MSFWDNYFLGQQQPTQTQDGVWSFPPPQAQPVAWPEPQRQAELRNYDQSLTERLKGHLSDFFGYLGADPYTAGNLAGKATGVAQLFPPTGVPLAANDMQRAGAAGDWAGLAGAALGVLPASGPAARAAVETARNVAPAAAPLGRAVLGLHETTTPGRIVNATNAGGYSVNLPSGALPTEGLMMGKYANTDPRNLVVPPTDPLKRSHVERHAKTNADALGKPENYFGSWKDPESGNVYFDVSRRFEPDQIRTATKFGERTGQLSGYNVGDGKSFPVGNWYDFIKTPEFADRVHDMAATGAEYLERMPNKNWWDTRGTSLERVYGSERLPQLSGFLASTAPVTPVRENMQVASEYMRRHISGEPTIQPGYGVPDTAMSRRAGSIMPMEPGRSANLEKSAAGNLDQLQRAKVREEAAALMGDPSAVVLDRHWARASEDPARGIFANSQEGILSTKPLASGRADHDELKDAVSAAATAMGRSPRDYSAEAWTGIRETIKNTGELFGQKFSGAQLGESKGYADHFDDLIRDKARHLKITVQEMETRLRNGDAELLSMMLATPAVATAYKQWQDGATE